MQHRRRPPGQGAEEQALVTRRADDLELLREKLLRSLGSAEPKELASISKELRAVNAELDMLAPPVNAGKKLTDELKARRARRTAT